MPWINNESPIGTEELRVLLCAPRANLIRVEPEVKMIEPLEKLEQLFREATGTLWQTDHREISLLVHRHSIILTFGYNEHL